METNDNNITDEQKAMQFILRLQMFATIKQVSLEKRYLALAADVDILSRGEPMESCVNSKALL
jgi:hypothetical protein